MAKKVKISKFGLQDGTESTVFITWTWTKKYTENYKVKWYYATGDGVWFVGSEDTTEHKQSTYSAPSNAEKVKVTVKPIATKNKKGKYRWTASWSTAKYYYFKNNPPTTPSVPSIEVDGDNVIVTLENINSDTKSIDVQIARINDSVYPVSIVNLPIGKPTVNSVQAIRYSTGISPGYKYKAKCRAVRDKLTSDWTDWSAEVISRPGAPGKPTLTALTETSVNVTWSATTGAESYDIEYTTESKYFDTSSEVQSTSITTGTQAIITGMQSGDEYFFRMRAVGESGETSSWSDIASITIGKKPSAPTTWSSTTTSIAGEDITLYWIHNAEDGSKQTYAEIEIYVDDTKIWKTFQNDTDEEDEDEENKTNSVVLVSTTEKYEALVAEGRNVILIDGQTEGMKLQWRVRTAGVTKVYGDFSVQREINIYGKPYFNEFKLADIDGNEIDVVTAFPFWLYAVPGPPTQRPIGYHVIVTANDTYDAIDDVGNEYIVSKDYQLFNKYFDINDVLDFAFIPASIDLENNQSYTLKCIASMNSGLTAEMSMVFDVAWSDEVSDIPDPDAMFGDFDTEDYSITINPYCRVLTTYKVEYDSETGVYTQTEEVLDSIEGEVMDEVYTDTEEAVFVYTDTDGTQTYYCEADGPLAENVSLSVYRKEYDGTFTQLAADLNNTDDITITDLHPSLDYARYRIVAQSTLTGAINYFDVMTPIEEKAFIIQWDEVNIPFSSDEAAEPESVPSSSMLLRFPYNIDVSSSYKPDVVLVEYIGRNNPVSYYGTQHGETATWSAEFDKKDVETLYALRRLAIWMGDVYVREPSGSGYWANVSVSFGRKHKDLTIPVTFSITRVEGGS